MILEFGFWEARPSDARQPGGQGPRPTAPLDELVRRVATRGAPTITEAQLRVVAERFETPDAAELSRFDPWPDPGP